MSSLAIAIAVNLVLGGVLLALLLARRGRDEVCLGGASEAIAHFRIHYPDADGEVSVAADGRGALIELGGGAVGLLERRGRRWNARLLAPGDVRAVDVDGGQGLRLRFADFSWPRARICLDDAEALAAWRARLGALTGAAARPPRQETRHA
ncbi:MAG: hypothetical protein HKM03_08595 [Steroidobacteraceae bacterium]|nr:hypothetical protein [Steroidobacteraceae bacterium]